ncbi:DUF916 domain-containing protein [Candidatus Saccharibacteria bacterium]|nr:DUF916 domain-containing protein [Candidatus Saccharibacteria bacterium]
MVSSAIKKLWSPAKLTLLLLAAAGLIGALPVSSALAADNDSENTPYLVVGVTPAVKQFEMHAGDRETVQMTIKNSTTYTEVFKLYASPYTILNSDYSRPNFEKQTSYSYLSKWITFEQAEYIIEPESEMTIEFQINVPESVPDGTQYAAVFAETTGYQKDGQKVGIRASGRVGMIVKAKMLDGKNVETAEITNQNIGRFQPDAPLKTNFSIKNTGNVEYKTQSRIVVKDFFGGKEKYKSTWVDTSVFPESHRSTDLNWEHSRLGVYKVTQEIKMMDGKTIERETTVLAVPMWVMVLFVIGLITLIVNIVLIIVRRKSGKGRKLRRSKKGGMKL